MTICYFTSTGNSLYVAKRLGGRLIAMPQFLKKEKHEITDETIGVVFPVYGLCVPPYVKEFLETVTFHSKYIFAIVTYGFYDGATVHQLQKIGEKNSKSFSYINKIKMVENYLPGFEMEKECEKVSEPKVELQIKKISEEIHKQTHWICRDSALDRFMTWTHEKAYQYSRGVGMTKDYQVGEACRGCGICEKVCPMNNIQIQNGRPEFSTACISCLACIQNCPEHAIHMKKEKSSVRYRNPHIKLQEIIAANQMVTEDGIKLQGKSVESF